MSAGNSGGSSSFNNINNNNNRNIVDAEAAARLRELEIKEQQLKYREAKVIFKKLRYFIFILILIFSWLKKKIILYTVILLPQQQRTILQLLVSQTGQNSSHF